mmetsp:Transcript_7635/g.25861  ORF Transcript_7635/g.25861 Transcript_7635/m.25861 type:complete len:102 (+) Transcript_7635:20-325(+)
MEVFSSYTSLVERQIEGCIEEAVKGYGMAEFEEQLAGRIDDLGGEALDVLLSISSFESFKDMMLSVRAEEQDGRSLDLELVGRRVPSPDGRAAWGSTEGKC